MFRHFVACLRVVCGVRRLRVSWCTVIPGYFRIYFPIDSLEGVAVKRVDCWRISGMHCGLLPAYSGLLPPLFRVYFKLFSAPYLVASQHVSPIAPDFIRVF